MPNLGGEVRSSLSAFQCGQRPFTLFDILQAAELQGELPQFRERWQARWLAAGCAASLGREPDAPDVEAATDEFRYARDLVSAEECDRWLAQLGLKFSDLSSSVSRGLQAGLAEEAPPAGELTDLAEGEEAFFIDAILAPEFPGWARALAWRAALAVEQDLWGGGDFGSVNEVWRPWDACYRSTCAALAIPGRQQRGLQQQWMNLTRVTFETGGFDSESAAREAICCVREDGVSLAEVARMNDFPCQTLEALVEDLPAEWRAVLASARPGDVNLVTGGDSGIQVVRLLARKEPRLDEPSVSARINQQLISTHFRELESRHVRWLIQLEATA